MKHWTTISASFWLLALTAQAPAGNPVPPSSFLVEAGSGESRIEGHRTSHERRGFNLFRKADRSSSASQKPNTPDISTIPMQSFTGAYAKRATEILQKPMFHRRGQVEAMTCEPALFDWLLNHPLRVAEFWRKAGADVGSVELIDGGYLCKDGDNGSCRFHIVYSSPELRVVYCLGEARRPPFPFSLRAEMVLVQRYRYDRLPDGRNLLVQQIDGFVSADGKTMAAVMKLARGKTNEIIDNSIANVQVFFSVINRVIHSYPSWALQTLQENRHAWTAEEVSTLERLLKSVPVPPGSIKSRPVITIVSEPIVPASAREP